MKVSQATATPVSFQKGLYLLPLFITSGEYITFCTPTESALFPHFLRHAEGSPRLRPARIERGMRDDFRNLVFRHAVLLRVHQVELERTVDQSLRHKRRHSDDAPVARAELVGARPHLSEQNIVIELRKL